MDLSKRLVHPTLLLFKFTSLLGIFPVNVDLKTHKISPNNSTLSKTLHSIFSFMMIVRDIHYLYATVENLINFKADNFPKVIMSSIWCCFTMTAALWNYELFHRALNTYVILFNDMDYENPDYRRSVSRRRYFAWESSTATSVRGRLLRWKFDVLDATDSSLQEVVVIFSPVVTVLLLPMYLAIIYFFPHWNIFLLSLVPVHWKVGWVVVAVWVCETLTTAVTIFSVSFVCFLCIGLQAFYFRQLDSKIREMRYVFFLHILLKRNIAC